MPGRSICEAGNVADTVREEGGESGFLVVQEGAEEGVGRVVIWDVVEGEGDGCAVAEGAPGMS